MASPSNLDPKAQALVGLEAQHILQTYKRLPVVIERGKGVFVYDTAGKEYLDFVAGIAVDTLGHCHPAWVEALHEQASTLVHTANIVYTEPGIRLAAKLTKLSGLEKVFFTNSGTEAIEASIKIARKWGKKKRGKDCFKIVSFEKSFHGRTFGALSATNTAKYQDPFLPLVPGFLCVPQDEQAVAKLLDKDVCAVIIESVQGESGVWPARSEFFKYLRELCDERDILLIADEIQTGIARTGRWFGFQHYGVQPDIVALAKGMGAGFPIGACLSRGEAANTLEPGEHGSTYAGSPLAAAVALKTLEVVEAENLVNGAATNGEFLAKELEALCGKHQCLDHVRGLGLMRGLEFKQPIARDVVLRGLQNGVLLNATSDTTLRFVPPLIITQDEIKLGVERLSQSLA